MANRVTQLAREALTSGSPAVRVTQLAREALTSGSPAVRVTQLAREVLMRLTYSGAPVWTAFTFSSAVLNVSYSQNFDLYPATSPTTYTLQSGSLPTGLVLSNVSDDIGKLSGTPTVAGSYTFTLRASNADGTADKAFTMSVSAPSGGGSFTFAG
jgi:hypothetical protein